MMTRRIETAGAARVLVFAAAGLGLCACSDFPSLNRITDPAAIVADGKTSTETTLIERDIEAPEAFDVTEAGLWDGRPSLGGVWVAHPDVKDPERVIVRNTSNGKFVIGALFRRERDMPGPRLQVSSDAAAALGMLAGAPAELNVTALRREVETTGTDEETAAAAPRTASAAPKAATNATPPETVKTAAAAAPKTPAVASSKLDKPYIQIGIFSVEENARRSADMMRADGMVPTVYKQEANGKTFWRVVVGPTATRSEQKALLKQINETGFTDAYAVAD